MSRYRLCKFRVNRIYDGDQKVKDELLTPHGYKASKQGKRFHQCPARYRFLIWGIKGGKTYAGAIETIRYALTHSDKLVWAVAPTYSHVDTCEYEIDKILRTNDELIDKHSKAKRIFHLKNGTRIKLHSAEWPNVLRGPNVDFINLK